MANRGPVYGLDAELAEKMAAKYDPEREKQAKDFITEVTGHSLEGVEGPDALSEALKNGVILCELANKVKPGSIPEKKISSSKIAFKMMENINFFLEAAKNMSIPSSNLFQTVDLYEARNMEQVINTILGVKTVKEGKIFQSHANSELNSDPSVMVQTASGYSRGANQHGQNFGMARQIIKQTDAE
eukprot:Nk52_evm78s158 gene=Nk52_evmTU78s158